MMNIRARIAAVLLIATVGGVILSLVFASWQVAVLVLVLGMVSVLGIGIFSADDGGN